MLNRMVAFAAALLLMVTTAEARRVALVIGQNVYPGGGSATIGLPTLYNPVRDAASMAELLGKHGFEVISCDGKAPGCFDLDRARLLDALKRLEQRAAGADLALAFFAGHGVATDEGNVLAPIDAKVNCDTGAVTQGVLVEKIMAATEPARMKLVILDACRDNPLGEICPGLKGKKLSFTRIEAGAMQGLLLVTSTQFGQQALDGLAGTHSPFATAVFSAFEANPGIYFEQVFNEVARATYEGAQKQDGFLQIPGRVVGGVAPADCLTGKDCVGDARMAALETENRVLAVDASGVRNLLATEEQARGKPYTPEERQKRVAELSSTLARIGTSSDPLDQEGRRLIGQGDVAGGQAKLEEALDADEKAAAEAKRLEAERRKAGAQKARNLAVLVRGTDVIKAISYYQRATRLDPSDPNTWDEYARAVLDAGHTDEAKTAFEQAAQKAKESNNSFSRHWATLGLGDVAMAQGNLPEARRLYEVAVSIAEPIAKADPGNAGWQRDLSVARDRIGDVLRTQGNLPEALAAYKASLTNRERLAKADPGNAPWQRDLSIAHIKIGDALRTQGNLAEALTAYKASYAIFERLGKTEPGNTEWQRDLSVAHVRIGEVLSAQGNLPETLTAYKASLAIRERLANADPGNAGWQRDLGASHGKIGDVRRAQGDLSSALESYRASLAILERLAKADPGNAGWQRDLSVSHNGIGEVLVEQGNLPAALESYRSSLAITERLAKADPGNAGWQYDLGISNERFGNVFMAQGNLDAALKHYRVRNEIISRLAKADLGNAEWQRDLSVSHNKIGDVLLSQGNLPEALTAYKAGFAIADRLAMADPGNAGWQLDLSISHERIGVALVSKGNLPEALAAYKAALTIRKRLAKADPENAEWQRGLALSHGLVAMVLAQQGERAQALAAFRKGRDIITKLKAAAPSNATLPKDLDRFDEQISALEKQ